MRTTIGLIAYLICIANLCQGQDYDTFRGSSYGVRRSEVIRSEVLNEERTLNIQLPSGHHSGPLHQYPVIYLLDGSEHEDFHHVTGLARWSMLSGKNFFPECIVVGIANVDRTRDFTFPTSVEKEKRVFPNTGGSKKFIQFLELEVLPFIEEKYSNHDTTILIGRSLGGLLATEILYKRPELFANYIILSPSLWWDGHSMLKQTPKLSPTTKSIYVGVGKNEHKAMVKSAKSLSEKLIVEQPETGRIRYQSITEADHETIIHYGLADAFDWMF